MKDDLPVSLRDLVSEPDTAWVEQQLMAHVRGLEHQGLPPRTIARAMARVLFGYCSDLYDRSIGSRHWIKRFLRKTGRAFIREEELSSDVEKRIDLEMQLLKDAEPHGTA
jgi:hypothetical protein